jgi:hypothetical protein
MERLKVMWGRKKFGIDMVMVNESREREREKGKDAGGPGDMRLFFRCGTPGSLTRSIRTACKVYKSIQNGEPSALDHTSTVFLDTTPLFLVVSPPH